MHEPEKNQLTRPLVVVCADGRSSRGLARIGILGQADRLSRAWKSLAFAWGVAFATVFVPILHFVLVPGFFAFGIYLFLKNYRRSHAILDGEAECPACRGPLTVPSDLIERPQREACPSCRWSFRMEMEKAP